MKSYLTSFILRTICAFLQVFLIFFFFFSVLFLLFSIICYRRVSSQTYCTYIHEHPSTILSLTAWILSYIYVLLRKDSGRVLLSLIRLSKICLYIYTVKIFTVMPTKSDSDIMPCLQLPSKNINLYTAPEPMRINRSLVYKSFPVDRINTQVTYRFYVPITLQTKHEFTVTPGLQDSI